MEGTEKEMGCGNGWEERGGGVGRQGMAGKMESGAINVGKMKMTNGRKRKSEEGKPGKRDRNRMV